MLGKAPVCGRRPAPGATARTLAGAVGRAVEAGRGDAAGAGSAVPVDGERVMPACLLAVASVAPEFRAATRQAVAQPVSSDTMIRAAAAWIHRRFNAIPSAAAFQRGGRGIRTHDECGDPRDLATALYARTDDLLKTAPETRMLQRGDTCGWGRITALWFCI